MPLPVESVGVPLHRRGGLTAQINQSAPIIVSAPLVILRRLFEFAGKTCPAPPGVPFPRSGKVTPVATRCRHRPGNPRTSPCKCGVQEQLRVMLRVT
jgi:hypothetical protein